MPATHIARPLDLSYPSNRNAAALTASSVVLYVLGGLVRPAPPEGEEGELVLAMDTGDRSVYGQVARIVLGLTGEPAVGTRALRVVQAVGAGGAVFATWALAREVLPDEAGLALPAAALVALQPAVWQLGTEIDPALSAIGQATFALVSLTRVASRSTGLPATLTDAAAVSLQAALATLSDRRLAALPVAAAAALAYDAARDGSALDAVARAGMALAAGAGALALAARARISQPRKRSITRIARAALQATAIAGGVGLVILAATTPGERIDSRCDNGAQMRRDSVLLARGLAFGWALFSAAAAGTTPLYALPPLAVAAAAGLRIRE